MTISLDREQSLALSAEITSARNLLAYGVRVLRTGAFIDTTRDPILTMLSIGVEKLYKLSLGLMALDEEGKWPTKGEMRERGHQLIPMHAAVMAELRSRTASHSQHVRDLVAAVDADPVVEPVVAALDMYGRMGRFYYLDQLGDKPQLISPDEVWQRIEQSALEDPEMAVGYQQAMGSVADNEVWEQFVRRLHNRIAETVERIWIMIAVSGRNHALGEIGTTFGFEVHPNAVGRQ